MVVGKIDFNNPKRGFRLSVNWDNYKDFIYDAAMEKKYVVLVCRECGQMLAPFIELAGPRGCGWRKVGKKWYCHQCSYHNGGLWNGSPEDKKLFQKEVEKRNNTTKKLIQRFQLHHPWINKIKYI